MPRNALDKLVEGLEDADGLELRHGEHVHAAVVRPQQQEPGRKDENNLAQSSLLYSDQ
jgi:hypothetical protein